MPPQDALAPLVEHLGLVVGAVASPATGLLIALLALWMPGRRAFLAVAALAGLCNGALEAAGLPGTGLVVAGAAGTAGALLQAWAMWPVARLVKRVGRALRSRAGV